MSGGLCSDYVVERIVRIVAYCKVVGARVEYVGLCLGVVVACKEFKAALYFNGALFALGYFHLCKVEQLNGRLFNVVLLVVVGVG